MWLTVIQFFGNPFLVLLIECFQIFFLNKSPGVVNSFWGVKLDERAVDYTNKRILSGKTTNSHFWPHNTHIIYIHIHKPMRPNAITPLCIRAQGNFMYQCVYIQCMHNKMIHGFLSHSNSRWQIAHIFQIFVSCLSISIKIVTSRMSTACITCCVNS